MLDILQKMKIYATSGSKQTGEKYDFKNDNLLKPKTGSSTKKTMKDSKISAFLSVSYYT
jgi:hypothetical protein